MISEIEKLFYPNGGYVRAIRFDKLLTKIGNDMQIDGVDEYGVARISIDNHLIFWDLNKSLNQQNIETIESIYKLINKYEKQKNQHHRSNTHSIANHIIRYHSSDQ